MLTPKQLKKELEQNIALKGLTETYEDVAVSRMQAIRRDVLQTRQFLEGVSQIYTLAKTAYLSQLSIITSRRKREKELGFIRRNQKTVAVLISGNQTLLGSIILQTYKAYLALTLKVDCDHVVIGKVGSYLLSSNKPPVEFTRFDLDDYHLDDNQIKPIIEHISKYEKILVVYPKFESVLRQTPQIDDISGGIVVEQAYLQNKRYFFEPSARDVMVYFEGQIIGSLFRQKVLESMLARYAARLTIMDQSNQAIKKIVNGNIRQKIVTERRESNKELLNSFAGIALWSNDEQ